MMSFAIVSRTIGVFFTERTEYRSLWQANNGISFKQNNFSKVYTTHMVGGFAGELA
jgi:hypothetical protein